MKYISDIEEKIIEKYVEIITCVNGENELLADQTLKNIYNIAGEIRMRIDQYFEEKQKIARYNSAKCRGNKYKSI